MNRRIFLPLFASRVPRDSRGHDQTIPSLVLGDLVLPKIEAEHLELKTAVGLRRAWEETKAKRDDEESYRATRQPSEAHRTVPLPTG